MEEQEAVETPVETTTETESAPVETNTDETPQESVATTEQPEKEVSKAVPYERFKEINEAKKALEAENAMLRSVGQSQYQAPQVDPDTEKYLSDFFTQKLAQQKIAEFRARHGAELDNNELLSIATEREMRKQQSQGVIDPETALTKAKQSLEKLISPAAAAAKEEGLKEGQDIAKTKQQLGAVGETGKNEKFDPESLSAAEYAKYMNIPKV